jgi:hypothetical protein
MTYTNSTGGCTLASVPRLDNFIERFTKERQYLKGVTPPTLAWYKYSFQAFGPVLQHEYETTQDLKAAVIQRIRDLQAHGRGNKAVSINTYLRCLKAFLREPRGAIMELATSSTPLSVVTTFHLE